MAKKRGQHRRRTFLAPEVGTSTSSKWATSESTSAERTLQEWLLEGPFTLVLSSSFFGFYAHAGLLTALLEAGVVPSAVAGSSGGAVIAAMWAAGLSVAQMLDALQSLTPAELLQIARPWQEPGGIFSTEHVQRCLQSRLEKYRLCQRLEDCAVPVAISTFDVFSRQTRVLREGSIAFAITASLAVPFFFAPVYFEVGRPLLDGGIRDLPGLEGVSFGERVLYHHASIVPSCFTAIGRYPESITLRIPHLPFVNPFTLGQAQPALTTAKLATQAGLQEVLASNPGQKELILNKAGPPLWKDRSWLVRPSGGSFFGCCSKRRFFKE
ncbi:unnamed protein product [Polarella glacialis]|uniref:PNPLA domain-containing protein n=1 Tax=Polarella glacialis TaxID=89957 RepID=A0A813I6K8_POLGL|nr:unnamed protein product [Polarella glacialis]CAE8647719.1 unnamed protein product [Polarella glacialis]